MKDLKEENGKIIIQENQSKLEIDQKDYFFYLIGFDNNNNFNKYNFLIINQESKERVNYKIESDIIKFGMNSYKQILYFKLTCKINSSIIIKYENNDKASYPLKLSENSLLGFVRMSDNIENKFLIKERNIIYTENLLNKFKCDNNLVRPYIEDYKSDMLDKNEIINFEEFTLLLKIFNKFSNLSLFLKELQLNNIAIYKNNDNRKIYQSQSSIYDYIIKNPKDELFDIYFLILYKFDENKLYKILESNNIYKNSIIRLFKNRDIDMDVLKIIIPEVILSFSEEDLNKLFVNYYNIEKALYFIFENFEIIRDNLKKKNQKITFDLPGPSKNDNIKNIFEIHQQINEKQKNCDLINIDGEKLIDNLINFNKDYDVRKLIDLKKFYFEEKSILYKIISPFFVPCQNKELDEIIHQTGINLSRKKNLENSEIVYFILNDEYYINNAYYKSEKRDLEIFENSWDFSDVNEEFVEKKLWKIFEFKLEKLYKIFINKVEKLDDIDILFRLFPLDNYKSVGLNKVNIFIELLLERIDNIEDYSYIGTKKDKTKLFNNFNLIFTFCNKNINEFTEIIEEKNFFDVETIKELYKYILSNCKNIHENKIKELLTFFEKYLYILDVKDAFQFIQSLSFNQKILDKLFDNENFQQNVIKENDFFMLKKFNSIALYKKLLKENILKKFCKTKYYNNSKNVINNIKNKLEKLQVEYLKINELNESNQLKKRLKLLFPEESQKNELENNYNILIKEINICKENLDKLNNRIEYLELFDRQNDKKRDEYLEKYKELKSNTLYAIINEKIFDERFNKFHNEQVLKSLKYNKCLFFMKLFNKISKINKDNDAFNETFKLFKDIFLKIVNENGIEDIIFYKEEDCKDKIEQLEEYKNSFIIILKLIKEKKDEEIKDEIKFAYEIINLDGGLTEEQYKIINNVIEKKDNLKLLVHKLKCFSYLKDIIFALNCLINLFKNLKPKNEDYQAGKISDKAKNIYEILSGKYITFTNLQSAINFLEKLEINIFETKNNSIYSFIVEILGKKDEIEFCKLKKNEFKDSENDIIILKDLIQENENGDLDAQDIDIFLICLNFFCNILDKRFKDEIELFTFIKEKIKNDEVIQCLKNYFEKYGEIKRFFDEFNKSESSESKITTILKKSFFELYREKNRIIFKGEDEKGNKLELKDLLKLEKKFTFSNDKDKYNKTKEEIYKFKSIINKLNILNEKLEYQILLGYKNFIKIKFILENGTIKNKENNKDLDMIINEFDEKIKKMKSSICSAYEKFTFLRFIPMHCFILIDSIIEDIKKEIELDDEKNNQLQFLFKAISNGKIKNTKLDKYTFSEEKLESLKIDNFINYYFSLNDLNKNDLEPVFEQNRVQKKEYKSGIYRAIYKNKDISLINLYKKLTDNIPLTNTVFICNELTTLEDIQTFLYLSCNCNLHIIFCLVGIEILYPKTRIEALNLIKKFKEKENGMNSILVILYLKDGNIKDNIAKIIPIETIKYEESENIINKIQYQDNNIEIFKSKYTGYGKSRMIENKILEEKREEIYFPLGGDFTREEILKRFFNLNLSFNNMQNYCIHIDLYETKFKELLRDILFEILFLKKLEYNGKIIYFEKIKFFIEIPNGYYNYLDKFPLLNLFKVNNIENMAPIQLNPNIEKIKDCDFRIVANFLSAHDNGVLRKENIDLDVENNLTDQEVIRLFEKYLKFSENNYNYYQIICCIRFLSFQFQSFNELQILKEEKDEKGTQFKDKLYEIRQMIIEYIIDVVAFLKTPFEKLIKSQTESLRDCKEDQNQQAIKSLEHLKDKIEHFTLIPFCGDKSTFRIIPSNKEDEVKYKKIYDFYCTLYGSRGQLFSSNNVINNYSEGDHYFFLEELKIILGLNELIFDISENEELNKRLMEQTKGKLDSKIYHPHENNEKDIENINKDRRLYMAKLAKLNGNYTYTIDNFYKTIIIYYRIQSGIPVILMGETGCGKTSLLNMLSTFMYKGASKMKILKCHSGTNDKDIIKFITDIENNIEKEEKEELDEIMKKFDDEKLSETYDKEKHKEIHWKKITERKIWVFFDELNTCDSIGLITEIICRKTMFGKKLSEKLLFLGAMNPYRAMTDKMKQSGLRYPTDKKKELVYSVNPLPHTLMNFVLNFGNLNENEEKEYIEAILQRGLERFSNEKSNFNEFINFASNCISKCHNFIREQSDISDVSLREINRINIFFEFFFDYLSSKSRYKQDYMKNELYKSLNLSIYSCYYLRISDNKVREALSIQLSKLFSEHLNLQNYNFLDIPDKEVSFITEQFVIDKQKGIILNKSLKENLFSAFISIINKIPLIIVGKPGESKSLSIQIIMKSMKGIYSKNDFFKKYPSIFKFDYQGSITSTSKGIISAFNKARNYAYFQKEKKSKKITNEELIVLLFFDEMGLAERSPNNPLKAIHGELEYSENDDKKIAFIAISNWKIDASKMNRCNILSKQINSDEEELIKTAQLIYKELCFDTNNSKLIEALAKSYYNIIKDDQSNFFGIRDFYYLIRGASREIEKLKKARDDITHDMLTKIGLKEISRNFGGDEIKLGNFQKNFEDIFLCDKNLVKNFNNKYNILDCINDNICDYNSRYLMLIIENLASIKALENILRNQNKEYYILQNQFNDNAKNSENEIEIIENLLNQIKYCITKECVLILKDLDSIYPSLYELFNRNYMKFGNKYFTKIAFSNSKVSSEVNPKLRIILLITQEQINNNKIDIPLLNRFEKQKVKFDELISDIQNFGKLTFKYKDLIMRIIDKWKKIPTFNEKDKEYKFRYNISKLMIFTENQIKWIIKESLESLTKNVKKIDDHNIEVELYTKIVPLFSQDIIASIKYSSFEQEFKETAQLIYELYKKNKLDNFAQFIKKIKKNKNIIYTFSNIFDSENFIPKEIENKFEIKNEIKSEKEINEILKYYNDQKNKEYLIFKLEEISANKLNYLTSLINNFETENKLKKKIILIYHLNRDAKEHEKMEFLCNLDDNYDKYFIDNLENDENNFDKILDYKNLRDLFDSMITTSEILIDNLRETFSLFEYNFKNIFEIKKSNDYLKMIKDNIFEKEINGQNLFDLIKEKALNMIFQHEEDDNKNINNLNEKILKMFTTKSFICNKVDFYHQLKSFLELELKNSLFSVIKFLEKRGVLSSLFLKNNNNEIILNSEIIQNQIINIFKKNIIIESIPSKKVKINIINGLKIPSVNFYINEIISFLNENIKAKYLENEYSVRTGKIKEKKDYDKNYQNLLNQIIMKLKKHIEINEIFENIENSEEILKSFYYDYLNIYCLEFKIKYNTKENLVKFLEFILQLKFGDKKNVKNTYYEIIKKLDINNFSEIFIFLECYKDEILLLLEVNYSLNSIMPKTFDLLKEIINGYKITEDDNNLKNIVNGNFILFIESYIKLIFKNKDKIAHFQNGIKNIYEKLKYNEIIFNQITKKLTLDISNLDILEYLIFIFNIIKNTKIKEDDIDEIINMVEEHNIYLKEEKIDNLFELILKLKDKIMTLFENDTEELKANIINLLRQEFINIKDENYRFKILKLLFENKKLIKYSKFFIYQSIKIKIPILKKYKAMGSDKYSIFEDRNDCEKNFLNFIDSKKHDKIFSFFDKSENEVVNQILLFYFEYLFNDYFKSLISILNKSKKSKKRTEKITELQWFSELFENQNLEYLKLSLNHIDNFVENKNKNEDSLNNLGRIYSIAYTKLYIQYLTKEYKNNNQSFNFNYIIDEISSKNNNARNVIKLYFFKVYYHLCNSEQELEDDIKKLEDFPFKEYYEDLNKKSSENKELKYALDNNLISMNDFKNKFWPKYLSFNNEFKKEKFQKLILLINDNFIKNNGIDILFCLSVNNLISFYFTNEKEKYIQLIKSFKNEFDQIIKENEKLVPNICSSLFNKLFNKDFLSYIESKKDKKSPVFEILMYSLRFVLQLAENGFYSNLFNPQYRAFINDNYIIGNLPYWDVHMESYYKLDKKFRKEPTKYGYYVCTCGYCYQIENCTKPWVKSQCPNPNCYLNIGGTLHKLIGPEENQTNHFRVIFNKNDAIKEVPCKLFEDYKREEIDKYLIMQNKGLNKNEMDILPRLDTVRSMNELGFRILNYILYSALFYSNLLGIIKNNDLNDYICKDNDCFSCIIINWNIIETILKEKGINNIKVFMNIIFDKITEILKDVKHSLSIEERNKVEKEINNYIEELVKNKKNYEKIELQYNELNSQLKNTDPNSLRELILENYSPFENIYSENEFPNLKMFLYSQNLEIDELKKCLKLQPNYIKNYCLLNQLLENKEDIILLQNIININKFTDILYKKYNHNITRSKAKTIKLIDLKEEKDICDEIKKLEKPFIKSWENIKSKCTSYACTQMRPLNIDEYTTLNNILPDNVEREGGMYILSAYTNFINWQNIFIDNILNNKNEKSPINPYLYQLKQEINAFEATKSDIIKVDEKFDAKLKDIINKYSMRDIFRNEKIDFKGFKYPIKIDFDSIEKELVDIILPGIKKFKKEEEGGIRLISYTNDSLRNKNNLIFSNYISKYPNKKLSEEVIKLLGLYLDKVDKENKILDFKYSCEVLIKHIQNQNYEESESIFEIMNLLQEDEKLDDTFQQFCINDKEQKLFRIDNLVSTYNIIELKCWNKIKEEVHSDYKIKIPNDQRKELKEYLENIFKENKYIISKQDLSNALRRFISRNLTGVLTNTSISESNKLFGYIQKEEFWDEQNENLESNLEDIFKGIKKKILIGKNCKDNNNNCENCQKMKINIGKIDCRNCEQCNEELRVKHALSFYEIMKEICKEEDNDEEKEEEEEEEEEENEN